MCFTLWFRPIPVGEHILPDTGEVDATLSTTVYQDLVAGQQRVWRLTLHKEPQQQQPPRMKRGMEASLELMAMEEVEMEVEVQ